MSRQRNPAQVLAELPGFENASVLGQLSDGPTNASFEIQQGSDRHVLRIDKPAARQFGLDREAEKTVYAILTAAGMAPRPDYINAEAGLLIRPFLPGRSWTRKDLNAAGNLERLADVLRRLHGVPVPEKLFEPLAAARRYANRLGTTEAGELFSDLQRTHAMLPRTAPALCHNDLVCQNVLESESLVLIDWEYAGAGDPFFDLAVVVEHHGLPESLEHRFLRAYLGRPAKLAEQDHLTQQKNLYAALLRLWQQL